MGSCTSLSCVQVVAKRSKEPAPDRPNEQSNPVPSPDQKESDTTDTTANAAAEAEDADAQSDGADSLVAAALAAPVASRVKDSSADAYSFKQEGLRVNQGDTEINCIICTEPLGSDPAEALNLCPHEIDRCACLVHRKCYLDPTIPMSDMFRKCLICHSPTDPELVKLAIKIRR
jgi:hypothetical protein